MATSIRGRSLRSSTRSYDHVKATGAHYTPPELATFLAARALSHISLKSGLSVLDPACGNGNLLVAVAELSRSDGHQARVFGLEQDRAAARTARARLASIPALLFDIRDGDFIDAISLLGEPQRNLFDTTDTSASVPLLHFDLVIANPPYVRTQVLGAHTSQRLAKTLGLSGRVDLYHAFVRAMSMSLREGGTLALLCSNRFLSTLSGTAVRQILATEYTLEELYDLGDTKLFDAAVLPAIVIAKKSRRPRADQCSFTRVYEAPTLTPDECRSDGSVLHAVESGLTGGVRVGDRCYSIERGTLAPFSGAREPWRLASESSGSWLGRITSHAVRSFEDIAHIRVGIKTTADRVFIRDDWDALPATIRPERGLLRPVLTHHIAGRWLAGDVGSEKSVLYPHTASPGGNRVPVDLKRFPKAAAYLERHGDQLRSRTYVLEAGRQWYEIWVPQNPADWAQPKIVFPDISETPKFFLDTSGAIVNGDCYWMTLRAGHDLRWLLLALGIANSTLVLKFYDMVCGNRLYAGRRRFITQYVNRFPLPDLGAPLSRQIIARVETLVGGTARNPDASRKLEQEVDEFVWRSFGFVEEIPR